MTNSEAASALAAWVMSNAPRQNLKPQSCGLAHLEHAPSTLRWEACWGVSCTLTFGMKDEPVLCWSSKERSIAEASASIALYRQAVEFACLLECVRSGLAADVARAAKKEGKQP